MVALLKEVQVFASACENLMAITSESPLPEIDRHLVAYYIHELQDKFELRIHEDHHMASR